MKNNLKLLLLVALSVFFTGCENPLNKNPVIAIIKNLSGSLKYYPGGSDEFVTLRTVDINNRSLFSMDMIEISKNSFLHLHFYGHGDAYLGNRQTETKLIITKPSAETKFQVLTELKRGVMDCFIEKKGSRFAVQTPVAVAGVLGTLFKVSVLDNKTFVTMIDGDNGTEIQNLQQSMQEPTILRKIQQIQINHDLVDPLTLTEKLYSVSEKAALSSNVENAIVINNFESPINFQYPVGVNEKGQLEFKAYVDYEGSSRTKTFSR